MAKRRKRNSKRRTRWAITRVRRSIAKTQKRVKRKFRLKRLRTEKLRRKTGLLGNYEKGGFWVARRNPSRDLTQLRRMRDKVLSWARTPGNHGGNPYTKSFVLKAEKSTVITGRKEMDALRDVRDSVLLWARTPGDHGGNPYTKSFVLHAMRLIKF